MANHNHHTFGIIRDRCTTGSCFSLCNPLPPDRKVERTPSNGQLAKKVVEDYEACCCYHTRHWLGVRHQQLPLFITRSRLTIESSRSQNTTNCSNNYFSCPNATGNSTYCEGNGLSGNIIFNCIDGCPQAGNCDDKWVIELFNPIDEGSD